MNFCNLYDPGITFILFATTIPIFHSVGTLFFFSQKQELLLTKNGFVIYPFFEIYDLT